MYYIRQESMFSLEQLLEMCPEEKYGGLKSKGEREQWLQEQAEIEAAI